MREVDVVGLATSRHGVGDNSVPPRAATPPRLPGFRLALSERRTYYTIYRLRATHLETVTAAQLGRLALTSPYELEREHG